MTRPKLDLIDCGGCAPPVAVPTTETVVTAQPGAVVMHTDSPVTRMDPEHARHLADALQRAADESELQLTDSTANEDPHEH
jgi:hypothetical protein